MIERRPIEDVLGPDAHAIGANITCLVGCAVTTPLYQLASRLVTRRSRWPAFRDSPATADAE